MRFKFQSLLLLFVLPFINSCVNNADFDQINVDIEPIVNVPIVYFELDQLDFFDIDNNVEIEVITDITDLEIFESATVRENLRRLDIRYEIEKSFPRTFTFFLDFLDANDNVTYSFEPIGINAGIGRIENAQILNLEANPQVLNTTKARVSVRLSASSSTLDPNIERFIRFKSIGFFYLTF